MELSEFARRVLLSDDLNVKLRRPPTPFTDCAPGPAQRIEEPTRPADLRFAARGEAPAMPKGQAFREESRRGIAHHIMANHELQALEVMAMVLLAFPKAPEEFRTGLAEVMLDEQRHTKWHADRSSELGVPFGSLPVNAYIWKKATEYASELEYVAGLPLVFEGRNLDHTVEFEDYFLAAGDRRSAAIMRAIHRDEIRHVAFGLKWLRLLKPDGTDDFEAWQQSLHWPMTPAKAVGDEFREDPRLAAGMTREFLDRLKACVAAAVK